MPILSIQIPELAFEAIANVAQAHGESVETFVLKAARRRAEEEAPIRLTPEQIAICQRGDAQIDAGEFYTAEQIRERFLRKKEEWLKGQKP